MAESASQRKATRKYRKRLVSERGYRFYTTCVPPSVKQQIIEFRRQAMLEYRLRDAFPTASIKPK